MIRKLERRDYKKFMELINYFTKKIKNISYEEFNNYYDKIQNNYSKVFIIEEEGNIIGTGKILIEYKFHNNLSKMGHIEDIVINQKYRGKGYGKKIVKYLIDVGKKEGCYKVILCSNKKNRTFYEKCGMKVKDIEMCNYFI